MRRKSWFPPPIIYFILFLGVSSHAQNWKNILPAGTAIDWSTAGIPGGIPTNWTQSGSTIAATGSDQTSAIQSALNTCSAAGNKYVQLAAGTFVINGVIYATGNCYLNGMGADQTILIIHSTSNNGAIQMGWPCTNCGATVPLINTANDVSITSGATAGSQSIVVSSAANIAVGKYLHVTELNESFVSPVGDNGTCNFCDLYGGTRALGQIVEVTSVAGTTIGISPGLYRAMNNSPRATPFTSLKYAGIQNLQIYANNTGAGSSIVMYQCAYCWASGIEANYTDGDYADVNFGYHDEIVNSYFSNAYNHGPGQFDGTIDIRSKSSGVLVQNNIMERSHGSVMFEWGASGNVVAYNYTLGNFTSGSPNALSSSIDLHGAHPEFNLTEGNIGSSYAADGTWGSSSHNTSFRDWYKGTFKACNPLSGRGTVVCTPTGIQGSPGVNGWWEVQQNWTVALQFLSTSYNLVGTIAGSQDLANLLINNTPGYPQPTVDRVVAVCGPAQCGTNSRSYDQISYGITAGYYGADSGGSGNDTLVPYNTLFKHGVMAPSQAILWTNGVTQTLPASFYLNAKPSWFGNAPWPPIGPDVTGGLANAYGYAHAIPAEVCYENVMGGTDGTGGPLTFNANTCYGNSPPPPSPPQELTGVVH